FTYFQQIGGIDLKPIPVELTYGLERIALFIQEKDNVFDLEWIEGIKYGEIHHQTEVEWSRFNFEEANIEMLFSHFDDYENEAKRLLKNKLVIPAYDFVLKCSHIFNLLDARGALSVNERARYIGRVRDMAKRVAKKYLKFRKERGFPLLNG
ncbi:MAG: glycine--tRNA ligase subunit alpha, partial [Actinomycetia bacterium]|nr:glycine--tRNA ligase subunit alpha [Actinomycetes bacterium]